MVAAGRRRLPFDDVAHSLLTRVGSAGLFTLVLFVKGKRPPDRPLTVVHSGRSIGVAPMVGSQTRLDQHVTLVSEPVLGGQRASPFESTAARHFAALIEAGGGRACLPEGAPARCNLLTYGCAETNLGYGQSARRRPYTRQL